jgi:hypothetical protein
MFIFQFAAIIFLRIDKPFMMRGRWLRDKRLA